MAQGDLVGTPEQATGASGEAAITFAGSPTAGHALKITVARSAIHPSGGAWSTPSGWTRVQDSGVDNAGNVAGAIWIKMADGTETAFATTDTSEAGNWRLLYEVYEGPFETLLVDVSAENNASLATVVTSLSTGTTAAPSQANGLVLASWCFDAAVNVDGTRGYTNSFNESDFASASVSTARAGIAAARKVVSAGGTQECTFSCSDTGDEGWGGIVFLKFAGGNNSYVETGFAVVGLVEAAGDAGGGVDGGGDVWGWVSAGAAVAALIDTGFVVWGAVAAGTDGAAAFYDEGGAGISGWVGAGGDVAALVDAGFAVVGAITAGADVESVAEAGAPVAGWIVRGADTQALIDAGFAVWGNIVSGDTPGQLLTIVPANRGETVFGHGRKVAQLVGVTQGQARKVK